VTTHLIVLAVLLVVPAIRRKSSGLLQVHLNVDTTAEVRLKADTTAEVRLKADTTRSVAIALPILVGVYLLGVQTWINWSFWNVGGGGRPRSVLYGIWSVERLSVDGDARPVELNDYDRRWRRVIFDTPAEVIVQRTDSTFARYPGAIDTATGTIALTKGGSRTWSSRFTYDRHSDDEMTLSGEMDGHKLDAELRRMGRSAFPLLNSTFRWIRPHDP
jgi:hypothetical protein